MVGRPKKKEESEKPFKILTKILNAIKTRKNSYCHQAYPKILVATLDFTKIQTQSQKSRKKVLNIQIPSLSQLNCFRSYQ